MSMPQEVAGGFFDRLLAMLKQRANYNQDLIGQRNTLETAYYNPPAPSESFGDVWNPNDRIRLAEGRRAQAGISLNNFNDVLKERQGSMTDLAGAVTRGYQEQQQADDRAFDRQMREKNYALDAQAAARAEGAERDERISPAELTGAYPSMFGRQGPDNPAGPKLAPNFILDALGRQAAREAEEAAKKDAEKKAAAAEKKKKLSIVSQVRKMAAAGSSEQDILMYIAKYGYTPTDLGFKSIR